MMLEDGITFSDGISSTDEPAVLVRDLTGRLTTWMTAWMTAWIELGAPDSAPAALRERSGRPHHHLHPPRSE